MGNCLVTKLNASVSDQLIPRLGHIQVAFFKSDSGSTKDMNLFFQSEDSNVNFELLKGNSDLTSSDKAVNYGKKAIIIPSYSEGHRICYNGEEGDIVDIDNKYNYAIIYINTGWIIGSLSQLFFDGTESKLKKLTLDGAVGYNNVGYTYNFEDIKSCPNLEYIQIRTIKIDGDFEHILDFGKLKSINIQNVDITGTLDSLIGNGTLKLKDLTTLNLTNTPNILKKKSTVEKLKELGVSVTVGEAEIVDDTV